MAATSTFLSSYSPLGSSLLPRLSPRFLSPTRLPFQLHAVRTFPALEASRRSSSSSPVENDEFMNERRKQKRFDFDGYEGDYDADDEEEDEDRSLDLLIKFVENIFRKFSKGARRVVRSVLPIAISTKLVAFAVNGLIILSFLWVLKAFVQVACTLGSVVFVSILLVRGVWSGVLYLQEYRHNQINGIDDDHSAWSGAGPVT